MFIIIIIFIYFLSHGTWRPYDLKSDSLHSRDFQSLKWFMKWPPNMINLVLVTPILKLKKSLYSFLSKDPNNTENI